MVELKNYRICLTAIYAWVVGKMTCHPRPQESDLPIVPTVDLLATLGAPGSVSLPVICLLAGATHRGLAARFPQDSGLLFAPGTQHLHVPSIGEPPARFELANLSRTRGTLFQTELEGRGWVSDSNRPPAAYKAAALPDELTQQCALDRRCRRDAV